LGDQFLRITQVRGQNIKRARPATLSDFCTNLADTTIMQSDAIGEFMKKFRKEILEREKKQTLKDSLKILQERATTRTPVPGIVPYRPVAAALNGDISELQPIFWGPIPAVHQTVAPNETVRFHEIWGEARKL
jgi:hypothetical protein